MAPMTKMIPAAALLMAGATNAQCVPQAPFDTPGDHTITVMHNGRERSAIVSTPLALFPGRQHFPTVLSFHGLGSSAQIQKDYSQLSAFAQYSGMYVVYPEGTPNAEGDTDLTGAEFPEGNAFNAGTAFNGVGCCGTAQKEGVDDIGFVNTLLDTLEETICADPDNTFATGFSNGGFMTYYLAYNMADRLKAVAPVSGLLTSYTFDQKLSNNMPVLHFHETNDPIVPYGGLFGGPGAQSLADAAAVRQGCTNVPTDADAEVTFEFGSAKCTTANCPAGQNATLCTIQGNTHTWFGATYAPPPFNGTGDITASAEILKFFGNNIGPEGPSCVDVTCDVLPNTNYDDDNDGKNDRCYAGVEEGYCCPEQVPCYYQDECRNNWLNVEGGCCKNRGIERPDQGECCTGETFEKCRPDGVVTKCTRFQYPVFQPPCKKKWLDINGTCCKNRGRVFVAGRGAEVCCSGETFEFKRKHGSVVTKCVRFE